MKSDSSMAYLVLTQEQGGDLGTGSLFETPITQEFLGEGVE